MKNPKELFGQLKYYMTNRSQRPVFIEPNVQPINKQNGYKLSAVKKIFFLIVFSSIALMSQVPCGTPAWSVELICVNIWPMK